MPEPEFFYRVQQLLDSVEMRKHLDQYLIAERILKSAQTEEAFSFWKDTQEQALSGIISSCKKLVNYKEQNSE